MDKDLQNYIKQMYEQGFSDERVRGELKKAGWSQEMIDTEIKAFGEIAGTPHAVLEKEPHQKKESQGKRGKKKFILPLSIIVGVFLIVGGVLGALYSDIWNPGWDPFGGDKNNQKLSLNEKVIQGIEIENNPIKPEELLNTSTWQTYRNEDSGFEIRYPEDWSYNQRPSFPPDFGIIVFFLDSNNDEVFYINLPPPDRGSWHGYTLISFEEIKVEGSDKFLTKSVFEWSLDNEDVDNLISINWDNDDWRKHGNIFMNYQELNEPNVSILNQIISTFKFIQ